MCQNSESHRAVLDSSSHPLPFKGRIVSNLHPLGFLHEPLTSTETSEQRTEPFPRVVHNEYKTIRRDTMERPATTRTLNEPDERAGLITRDKAEGFCAETENAIVGEYGKDACQIGIMKWHQLRCTSTMVQAGGIHFRQSSQTGRTHVRAGS